MSISKSTALSLSLISMTACSGSSSSDADVDTTPTATPTLAVGSAANTDGEYSVVQGTTTTTLPSGSYARKLVTA